MTVNQINYGKLLEEVRHNKEMERVSGHQADSQRIQAEASRSQADTARGQLSETATHNREQEATNWFNARNQQQYWQTAGTAALQQAEASMRQASASVSQAQTAAKRQVEDARHNLQVENETRRNNLVSQALEERSTSVQSAYNVARAAEQERHNLRQESIEQQNAETQANVATVRQQEADVKQQEANTKQFASYFEAFKDAALGVNQGAQAASKIVELYKSNYNPIKLRWLP